MRLRLIGFIEGVTFLMLFAISMPLKYMMGIGEPNKVIGYIHGVFFIAYIFALIPVSQNFKWDWKTTGLSFVASLLPFGTFVADARIFRKYA